MNVNLTLPAEKEKLALGLMSGTSCDGLDIALIAIKGQKQNTVLRFLAGRSYPYTEEQREKLLELMQPGKSSAAAISQWNFYLAQLWAEMVLDFLRRNNRSPEQIDFIGSHGQTLWHQPQEQTLIDRAVISTLQIGDPSVLAKATGIPVVGDFRVADMALGGQGAPLIPYFDWVYFSQFGKNILAVNIGGIANFTFVPADGALQKVTAFDCGPGNMLLDQVTRLFFRKPFDADGRFAAQGTVSPKLLAFLKQSDAFVPAAPPKSTGREHYNRAFVDKFLSFADREGVSVYDVLHTLTVYTAYGIHENYRLFIQPKHRVESVAVSGGGSRNPVLMDKLQQLFGAVPVKTSVDFGLDDEFKEAIGFAVLANETLLGNPSNVPQVTGAAKATVLGKICLP